LRFISIVHSNYSKNQVSRIPFIGIYKGGSKNCALGKKLVDTPIYDNEKLKAGNIIVGPAIIEVRTTTAVIPPDHQCNVDDYNNYVMR
jgi:N-methylhydantoinase A/oxoprolinase/acetone carboxylase beta subunit